LIYRQLFKTRLQLLSIEAEDRPELVLIVNQMNRTTQSVFNVENSAANCSIRWSNLFI
jgi:hypothetical protein